MYSKNLFSIFDAIWCKKVRGKFFIWGIVFMSIFLPANLSANTKTDRIISSWQEKYQNLSTYTAQYSQRLYYKDELRGETSGRVFFKKPHFFRWEVIKPEEQIIVGDGEIIWVYLPRYKQLLKRSYSPEESFGPFWFTSTEPINRIKQNFIVTRPFSVKARGEKIQVLEFRPKREIADINQVNLWLEPKSFLPLRVEVFLNDGTLARFTYKDVKMNVSLPDALFKLKLPNGIEIFEE